MDKALANRKRLAGQRIKQLRVDHKLTLVAFGKLINYSSHSVISQWEQGSHFPSGEALVAMQTVFGVSPAWLLGEPTDG